MSIAIQENMATIIISVSVLLLVLISFKIYKFKKLCDLDEKYKTWDNEGHQVKEGLGRNIWDYSFFPGISRLWHQSEWQTATAMLILGLLILVYIYTKDINLLNLLGVNLGIVVGMLVKRKE